MITHFKPNAGTRLRCLVSVTNKSGLEKLRPLIDRGAEIVSTGGTAKFLKVTHGIQCTDVFDVTGFPEILDGRVKILHPNIFGALLADQNDPTHMKTIAEHGIEPFHVVFVNLYNFAENPAISEIDVGGPSALRAAAKAGLIVVVDPDDYGRVIDAMMATDDGSIPKKLRLELICKVFMHTSQYDSLISEWLEFLLIDGGDPFATASPSPH